MWQIKTLQNSTAQNLTTQKDKCDITKTNFKPKTQIATQLKHSSCDKTQNLKLWKHLKTLNVTKLKISNCGQIQRLKLWQNFKK